MADRVTRLKPAKHGQRLQGKRVITFLGGQTYQQGIYYNDGKTWFRLESATGSWLLDKSKVSVSEIIETVE